MGLLLEPRRRFSSPLERTEVLARKNMSIPLSISDVIAILPVQVLRTRESSARLYAAVPAAR